MATTTDLPLLYQTPPSWAEQALREPLALLDDHAHLEKKAASNALELIARWPGRTPPDAWVRAMTQIAQDEAIHLHAVTRLLERRGGSLSRDHRNRYAGALHRLVRWGRGSEELLDRLLISALIEARSCERFALLADASDDKELADLYRGLWRSEHGHYKVFVGLAEELPADLDVQDRWGWMLAREAEIIQEQPPGPTMHSGVELIG